MNKTRKLKNNKTKREQYKKTKCEHYKLNQYKGKGGELLNKQTDLQNKHMCGKDIKEKDTPGLEIYQAIDSSFQLNERTSGFLLDNFKKSKNMWFKFVLFNNSNTYYIYIITGAQINKHSVCLIHGLLDVTPNNEYIDLREKFNNLKQFKSEYGIVNDAENMVLIQELNNIINRDIPCMPVISAGSGTVNDDDPNNIMICINNKSGHYKPTIESMEFARYKFKELTGINTVATEKADKELLKIKYGKNYDMYSGICL